MATLAFLVAPLFTPSPPGGAAFEQVSSAGGGGDATAEDVGDPGLGLKESRSGFADLTLAFLFPSRSSAVNEPGASAAAAGRFPLRLRGLLGGDVTFSTQSHLVDLEGAARFHAQLRSFYFSFAKLLGRGKSEELDN